MSRRGWEEQEVCLGSGEIPEKHQGPEERVYPGRWGLEGRRVAPRPDSLSGPPVAAGRAGIFWETDWGVTEATYFHSSCHYTVLS